MWPPVLAARGRPSGEQPPQSLWVRSKEGSGVDDPASRRTSGVKIVQWQPSVQPPEAPSRNNPSQQVTAAIIPARPANSGNTRRRAPPAVFRVRKITQESVQYIRPQPERASSFI